MIIYLIIYQDNILELFKDSFEKIFINLIYKNVLKFLKNYKWKKNKKKNEFNQIINNTKK